MCGLPARAHRQRPGLLARAPTKPCQRAHCSTQGPLAKPPQCGQACACPSRTDAEEFLPAPQYPACKLENTCAMNVLHKLLTLPETRGLDLDDPHTSELRKNIIARKGLLKKIYDEWHGLMTSAMFQARGAQGICLELGAGGDDFSGFCKRVLPRWKVCKSDILPISGMDMVADATHLPVKTGGLDAIVLTNVFHHIPDCVAFLQEAARVLKTGGTLCMIEPWNTPWGRFIYTRLHSEPFDPDVADWHLNTGQPLTAANGALPWIVFHRDAAITSRLVPEIKLARLTLLMPVAYLASGGISMRSLAPGWLFKPLRKLEQVVPNTLLAMFAFIQAEKVAP